MEDNQVKTKIEYMCFQPTEMMCLCPMSPIYMHTKFHIEPDGPNKWDDGYEDVERP